jgi:hypothetical protein
MRGFFKYFKTRSAIKKTISYIKKNKDNAFQMGREFCTIYSILYEEFKKNELFNTYDIWDSLLKIIGFKDMIIYEFVNKEIDFPKYFSKCNLKILTLNSTLLSSYFRGYYINDLNLYSTNISANKFNETNQYFVLYDNHYHYLLFIYNYLSTNHTNTMHGIHMQLNDKLDKYSINEESDEMCYKLIFEKKRLDFIDPIRLLLNFLYKDVFDHTETLGKEDKYLYLCYLKYKTVN